ncbi:hypothetical protein F4680DRAFT_299712 [Xylaria scruposa]|nr:hypothetical protein F4680DRAFT_299712 [Xylaria scruposa]
MPPSLRSSAWYCPIRTNESSKPELSTAVSGSTAFPRFLDLPLEIREMIWKFALPGPRGLLLPHESNDTYQNLKEFKMPLSQVCFESRRIMLEAGYQLAHTGDFNLPSVGVWFCEERGDVVLVFYEGKFIPFGVVPEVELSYYLAEYFYTDHLDCC